MSDTFADPEKHFAIGLHLAVVSREDYDRVRDALVAVRDEFCRGGSSIAVESVRPQTVVNR